MNNTPDYNDNLVFEPKERSKKMKITNENIGKFDKDKGIYCGIFNDKEVWISLHDAPDMMPWSEALEYCEKQGGILPDIDTLSWVFMNKKAINEALEANGGEELDGDYYWSSSENNNYYSWILNLINGNRYNSSKNTYYYVRVFQLLENCFISL